ncbi:hypothetical protein ElyMa_005684100 [Elysia marginata]|uniref:Uncharacterized protein n=1 Tax=Elysia marginata TaxID=1093978 RepID=A0AAV4FFS7_9GAST|nr:hypothetical protein ElyMa_005684100 [Elysia marginata]
MWTFLLTLLVCFLHVQVDASAFDCDTAKATDMLEEIISNAAWIKEPALLDTECSDKAKIEGCDAGEFNCSYGSGLICSSARTNVINYLNFTCTDEGKAANRRLNNHTCGSYTKDELNNKTGAFVRECWNDKCTDNCFKCRQVIVLEVIYRALPWT